MSHNIHTHTHSKYIHITTHSTRNALKSSKCIRSSTPYANTAHGEHRIERNIEILRTAGLPEWCLWARPLHFTNHDHRAKHAVNIWLVRWHNNRQTEGCCIMSAKLCSLWSAGMFLVWACSYVDMRKRELTERQCVPCDIPVNNLIWSLCIKIHIHYECKIKKL